MAGNHVGADVLLDEGIGGIASSISRFSASISPWMLPPFATSITGKRVVSMMSPATMTSDGGRRRAVGVAVRGGLVKDLDPFVVHAHVPARSDRTLRWARRRSGTRRLAGGALIRVRTLSCARIAARAAVGHGLWPDRTAAEH